ncbi:MAG: hypothetical protein H0V86_10645 [Chloroflexia bacterium]|nr:hypothetical protein [Chloroflexia bacterium]
MSTVLLDENLLHDLAHELTGNEVHTVRQMHWNGRKNGELLRLAAPIFDVLVTADHSLEHE